MKPGDLVMFRSSAYDTVVASMRGPTDFCDVYNMPSYWQSNIRLGVIRSKTPVLCIATYVERYSHRDFPWAYLWGNDCHGWAHIGGDLRVWTIIQ